MKKRIALLLALVMVVASFAVIATGCKRSTIIEGDFTYNDYLAGSPENWNNHTWNTSDDSYILGFTDVGLYSFELNAKKDGYKIVNEMAAKAPVDVTKKYAGDANFGVPEDATEGYAWKIALNKDAVWEAKRDKDGNVIKDADGNEIHEAINADTYIYSMQQQLNQQMLNRRADSWYAGDLVIANAKNYLYSGTEAYTSLKDKGFESVAAAIAGGYTTVYVDFVNFWGGTGPDGEQYLPTDSELIVDDGIEPFTAAQLYNDYFAPGKVYESYIGDYLFVKDAVPVTPWDKVGVLKTGEYEITLVLQKPITQIFYVYYNLSGNWIVYKDLYESCKTQSGDLIVSTYGTSVETTMSYGPYKLSEFQADKEFTLVRNESWYGYWDGQHKGQYQTSKIVCQTIETQATALQMFLAGQLDGVALTAADMDTYRFSDYILYTPQSYTQKFSFSTDYDTLKARETATVNKTMLTYQDFRNAISLCLDRADYAATQTASHKAGFGLLNYTIVYDPDTGAMYRDSDYAKEALVKFYVGTDWKTKYKNLDEAYDKMTGYNKDRAKALFNSAYTAAVAAGDLKPGQIVTIEYAAYGTDTAYVSIFNWLKTSVEEGVRGTSLEGRVTFSMTADSDYPDHMKAGQLDFVMSTWGGAAFSPFSLISNIYVDDTNRYEYGFTSSVSNSIKITLKINGKDVTMGLKDWADSLAGVSGAKADYSNEKNDVRCMILAALEYEMLKYGHVMPMVYRQTATLSSAKVTYGADYINELVGRGGIQFMTYNYDDAQWAALIASGLPY